MLPVSQGVKTNIIVLIASVDEPAQEQPSFNHRLCKTVLKCYCECWDGWVNRQSTKVFVESRWSNLKSCTAPQNDGLYWHSWLIIVLNLILSFGFVLCSLSSQGQTNSQILLPLQRWKISRGITNLKIVQEVMSDTNPHSGSYKWLFPVFWKLSLTLWSERSLKIPGKYNTGAQGQPKAWSTGHTFPASLSSWSYSAEIISAVPRKVRRFRLLKEF